MYRRWSTVGQNLFSTSSLIQFYSRSNKKKKLSISFFFFKFSIVLHIFISIWYKTKNKQTHIRSGFLLKSGPAHFHQWLNLQFSIDHPNFFSFLVFHFFTFSFPTVCETMRDMKEEVYICKLLGKVVGYFPKEIEHFFLCVCVISFFYHFSENRILFGFVICSRFPPPIYISLWSFSLIRLLSDYWANFVVSHRTVLDWTFFFYIFTCIDRSFFNWLKTRRKKMMKSVEFDSSTYKHHRGSFEMR